MANMNFSGFDQLIGKLQTMGKVGDKIANDALKQAAQVIVQAQKIDAPRHQGGPANGKSEHGADALSVGRVTTSRSKNKYIQIGITDASVWEYAKGIYFLHHGFYNHISNKYIAGSQWMDTSFEKASKQASDIMISALQKELKF